MSIAQAVRYRCCGRVADTRAKLVQYIDCIHPTTYNLSSGIFFIACCYVLVTCYEVSSVVFWNILKHRGRRSVKGEE